MSNYPPPPPSRPANYSYPPSASPTNSNAYAQPPPAKRARLSPDARSPQQQYAPPPQQYGGYGNPYQPQQQQQQQQQQSPYGSPTTYAGSPQAFNTPQWHPQWQNQSTPRSVAMSPPAQTTSAGMMPPPPRPNKEDKEERNVNIDDIGDSLYGSGVSIKDEENYLLNVFQNRHGANTANESFASTANNTSFASSSTTGAGNTSFNHLPTLASHSAFSGTLGPTQSQDHIDQVTQRARAAASVSRNLAHQHPLSSGNQFLLTNPLRKRLMARAHEQGVSVNTSGLWQRAGQPQAHETRVMMGSGVNGAAEGLASVVVDTRPEFTASKGDAFEVVLSLVCLAVEGRLRGLVEDGARRYGDHGRVAPEFAGVAQGLGGAVEEVVVPEAVTGGNWDRVDAAAAGGGEMSSTPQPMPTISFQSAIARKLRSIAQLDEAAELSRTNKRLARQRAQALKDAAATDDPMADVPPELAPELPKITKKELARKEKEAKLGREANSAANINSTIALATGGKKKRQYGWMTGGASAEPSNRFKEAGPKSGSGAVTPVGKVEGGGAIGSPGGLGGSSGGVRGGVDDFTAIGLPAPVRAAEWGEWREDVGVGGEGRKVQGRDWVVVLERDGRGGRALQRFFTGVGVVEGV
ncbi:hypothetical protein LTR97_002892 [Elasticomyces elasticus]|uniref:TBP-associated factor 4 n=1 Tax=Elasticomyces elasticus TaxID=574655 RepID=A0AAN7WFH4_9PEZI|nr:hypothetical protein LTR97_002892 [Elasticomyces elasticus]